MTPLESYLLAVRALRRLEVDHARELRAANRRVADAEKALKADTKAERRAGREPSSRPLPRLGIH